MSRRAREFQLHEIFFEVSKSAPRFVFAIFLRSCSIFFLFFLNPVFSLSPSVGDPMKDEICVSTISFLYPW